MAAEPPKIAEAKCSHNRMLRPEESKPPRYRYSLRRANMAAREKQPKATAVPTKALTKILEVDNKSCKTIKKQAQIRVVDMIYQTKMHKNIPIM